MNRRLRREQSRLRKIEFLVSLTLVFSMSATGLAIVTATAPGVAQEHAKVQAETQPMETPATEPKRVEEPKAPKPIRYEITAEELEVVARVVQAEAGGEGYDGQALVAQCILNTAEAKGIRPDEVVMAPRQYAAPALEAGEEVKQAVTAVFLDGYQVTEEPIRFFYAPARCESQWHETSLDFVLEYGGHRFFKTK